MYQRVMAIIEIISDYLADDFDLYEQEEEIVDDLVSMGFDFPEIETALSWIANLSRGRDLNRQLLELNITGEFQRHFTQDECRLLALPVRNWLMKLRQLEILDQIMVEDIIDQAMCLGAYRVGLDEIKIIATMVVSIGQADPEVRDRFLSYLENDRDMVFH
jgi:uncharacterized protein Smg (DUF494 family)